MNGQLLGIPFVSEYLGIWAMEEGAANALIQQAAKLNLHVHMQTRAEETAQQAKADMGEGGRNYPLSSGLATFQITGPMQKQSSSFSGGTSTIGVRRQLRAAKADPECSCGLMVVDSPGGTVSGNQELCDEMAAFAREKPLYVQVEDMACSAAYGAASQGTKVFANRNSWLANIGTYMAIHDLSKMAEQEGIKVHVVKAGEFKGAGTPGTEITTEQLEHYQSLINDLNEDFIQTVSRGRKMSQKSVRDLADGKVLLPDQALKAGLIDGVQSRDETIEQLRKARKPGVRPAPTEQSATGGHPVLQKGPQKMDGSNDTGAPPSAASHKEIKAACPNADAEFICSQLEKDATVEQARAAWMVELHSRLTVSQSENAQLKAAKSDDDGDDDDDECETENGAGKPKGKPAKPAKPAQAAPAPKKRPGVQPVNNEGASEHASSDPKERFNELVAGKMAIGMKHDVAARAVCKENPGLREEMVAAANRRA
ncbi:MAG TPA: S49 family peptidase, partial [Planctomycetaceae bacterium]|nr:S49 family peptidase [Planctomycetaceae bacterium]